MRLRSFSATALAAAAIFQPLAFATAQAPAVDTDNVKAAEVVQAAAIEYTTSATTTYTVTRTVMRVVQTEYATRNTTVSTTATPSLASASLKVTPYVNGTASMLSTGAASSTLATQSARPMMPTAAASRFGLDVAGLTAVAGMIGLLVA